jgi:hypothetical protein
MTRDRTCSDHGCLRRDELVAQTLVRPFFMIMKHEASHGRPEVPFARSTIRSKHSDLADSTNRSANAFRFGLHAGRTTGVTPLSRSKRRNAAV